MREYLISIEKRQSSILTVPAKNKKDAVSRAERLIDDMNRERIDIDRLISWNPEYKIKIKKSSTKKGAFFIGGN